MATNQDNAKLLFAAFELCGTEEEFTELVRKGLPDPRLAGLLWHSFKLASDKDTSDEGFSEDFPTQSGHYVWREIGSNRINPTVALVTNSDGVNQVYLERDSLKSYKMTEIAPREWKKVGIL